MVASGAGGLVRPGTGAAWAACISILLSSSSSPPAALLSSSADAGLFPSEMDHVVEIFPTSNGFTQKKVVTSPTWLKKQEKINPLRTGSRPRWAADCGVSCGRWCGF